MNQSLHRKLESGPCAAHEQEREPLRQCRAEERRAKSRQNFICLGKTWCSVQRCFGVGKVQFQHSSASQHLHVHTFCSEALCCAVLKAETRQRLLPVEVSPLKKRKKMKTQWRSSLLTCALAAELLGSEFRALERSPSFQLHNVTLAHWPNHLLGINEPAQIRLHVQRLDTRAMPC